MFIRIGTRPSPLALKQTEEVMSGLKRFHPDLKFEVKTIFTTGDRDRLTPISRVEGTDFFTKEIEEALLKDGIDFAVHSAKDLPDYLPKGLTISAITKSIDPYDVLVSGGNLKINELPKSAEIGTSSLRRKYQLLGYRNDFKIADIRGNIHERLDILDKDGLDAIVIAGAGLVRLGLEQRITQRLPFEILRPHPLQGALAIEARQDNKEIINLVKVLDTRK